MTVVELIADKIMTEEYPDRFIEIGKKWEENGGVEFDQEVFESSL